MSYGAGFGDPNQLAQRITSNIQKITQCSAEIQRILHQLGTPQDTPELRQQLEEDAKADKEFELLQDINTKIDKGVCDNIRSKEMEKNPTKKGNALEDRLLSNLLKLQQKQQYTNQLAKETDKHIKEFGSLPATSEQRQRKIQKDRLVGEFTTALTNFQRLQRQAAEKEKDFVARVRASSRVSGGAPEDAYKERTLVSWDSQPQAQQVQDEEITEDDLRLIQERESSIRQLEADIMDINEIFKDLGMMIHEQGDVIDSIEANVESADVHVQQANQQLSRAADYQQRSRKKMCILIIVLAVGVLLLGIIIWLFTR